MKKNTWFSLFVLGLGLFSLAIISGCGSNATGGGGGGGGGKSGKLVDPYIDHAIIYVDLNNSGSWDAGEPTAETNGQGSFTFSSAPSLDSFIRIKEQGIHLGVTYDAELARQVDGTGNLNITPLTTLLSNGISAESIRYILSHYAAITPDANDMRDDPMLGLVLSDPTSIDKLRGAICTYSLIKIISAETGVNGSFELSAIEGNASIEAALNYMGNGVRNGLSDDILDNINSHLTTAEINIKASLEAAIPGASVTVNFPPVNANDIANSAFALTEYLTDRAITNSPTYDPCVEDSTIETLAQDLGQRYYTLRTVGSTVITVKMFGTVIFSSTMNDAMISGEVVDGSGNMITTFEVNSTTEAFKLNPDGTIKVIWN